MNRRIRRLAVGILVCYVALFVQINRVQVFDAATLNSRPDNKREVLRDFNSPRGTIVSADGRLLAFSQEIEGQLRYQRVYPLGELFAHVVGTYSFDFGSDGVERQYNDELAGRTFDLQLEGYKNPFLDDANVGDVHLTLPSGVQEAARSALGERNGSVVAIDPRNGAVLALWSYPAFDPNVVSSNDVELARTARDLLNADPDKPMLAKAYQDRFAPGSTFKVVTGSAGVDAGKVDQFKPDYPVERAYTPPLTNRPISNFGRTACGGRLFDILRVSCNTAFARMGAETLGPQPMIDTSGRFGFNQVPPIDLPRPVSSVFPTDFGRRIRAGDTPGSADVYEDTPALAQSAIGQNNVAASPLQMALVAAAVANGGAVMTPHVMESVTDSDGDEVDRHEASVWTTATSQATADLMRLAMIEVVRSGTATAMAIPGVEVGGKTGTAQLGTEPPRSHAWVIGFAGPPGQPAKVAVAVIVEGQPGNSEQTGGMVAAPIAKQVIQAALAAS